MTFALATLLFLSAAWFAIQTIAATLDGKTWRIGAALRGELPAQAMPVTVRVSPRYPSRVVRQALPKPQLRAAA